MNVKTIGGNKGRSSIGAAAYRAGEKLYNEHDNITHDYTKRQGAVRASAYRSGQKLSSHDFTHKRGIVHSEIMLPSHAPEIFRDRNTLWNSAEQSERNHNARTGREVIVALPNELTPEQQIAIVRDYVQLNFVDKGMCADFSVHSGHIHDCKNEAYPFQDATVRKNNPHAHIQLTVRPLNYDGTWGAKSRKEYILDGDGKRIKLPSGNWRSRKVDATDWDKTDTLIKWREDWAVTVNKGFEQLDISESIDHRTLKAQGINREPTTHMGHEAWHLEKKGIVTDIGNVNRGIMARNRDLEQRDNEARAKLASVQKRQRASREKAARAKLASVQSRQWASQKPTAQAVAEYMNKLNKDYITLKNHVSDIHNRLNERERELAKAGSNIKALQQRTDDISMQNDNLIHARSVLDSVRSLEDKRVINAHIRRLEDTYRRSWDYYQESFGMTPNEGYHELRRLKLEYHKAYEDMYTLRRTTDTASYAKRLRDIEMEYKRQRLLAGVRPNGRENVQYLDNADVRLCKITNDDFREIVRDMTARQVDVLRVMFYGEGQTRGQARDYGRGR